MRFATVTTGTGPRAAVVDGDRVHLFDESLTVLDLVRLGVPEALRRGLHTPLHLAFSYFLDPLGNTVEYTTELEAIDEDTWHPHLYDFSDPEVTDQWGTSNPMSEFVAKKSFNDRDLGVFVAPPV